MKFFTKLSASILFTILLITTSFNVTSTSASPIDVNGGVMNEYEYSEVFFLTGEPVTFSGKAVVTEKENKNTLTRTYRFTLTGDKDDYKYKDAKLTRSVSYVANVNEHEGKGQTTSQFEVKSYSEKVTFGKDTYTLADYQYSEGMVADNLPASTFYSGIWLDEKSINT